MLQNKKRRDHAGSDEIKDEPEQFDFAWLLYMGMQFGYSEKEVSKLYLGKWADLFEVHKRQHNFEVCKGTYSEQPEKTSLLNL